MKTKVKCPTGYRRFLSRESALSARFAMLKRSPTSVLLKAMWCAQCRGCHLVGEPKRLLEETK